MNSEKIISVDSDSKYLSHYNEMKYFTSNNIFIINKGKTIYHVQGYLFDFLSR
jgi:hypothetical protein